MRISTLTALALLTLLGCSSGPKEEAEPKKAPAPGGTPQASIEAKQLAAENEARFVTELSFRRGQDRLTPQASKRLEQVLREARMEGKPRKVTVLTWADREYPSVHTEELPEADRKLAEKRAEAVEKFVKARAQDLEVDTYNMAERTGSVGELLSTAEARLKKSLEVSGIPNTDTSVKTPSKASRAIVMVSLEE